MANDTYTRFCQLVAIREQYRGVLDGPARFHWYCLNEATLQLTNSSSTNTQCGDAAWLERGELAMTKLKLELMF